MFPAPTSLKRRLNAASRGIKSLYLSKASLSSEICIAQCHHFMTIVISNLKLLLTPQFSTLESIAYCFSIESTGHKYGRRPELTHIVMDICELPLTCRLFEIADLCKEAGYYGEFEIVINEIKKRPLDKYLYELGASYSEKWNFAALLEEMIYDQICIDIVLDSVFGCEEDSNFKKLRYFVDILNHNYYEPYLLIIQNHVQSCSEFEILNIQDEIECLLLYQLMRMKNREPVLVLAVVFSFLILKDVYWSTGLLQSTYGYIKAVEHQYGYSKVIEFLKLFEIGVPKSFNLFFETSLSARCNKNVDYSEHPHFCLLLNEGYAELDVKEL